MQIVPITQITQNALVFDSNDWRRLGTLMTDFDKVCNKPCELCPLKDFCLDHECPAEYLKCLYEFLDN